MLKKHIQIFTIPLTTLILLTNLMKFTQICMNEDRKKVFIYVYSSNEPVSSNMKAIIVSDVVIHNAVNREKGNLNLYF